MGALITLLIIAIVSLLIVRIGTMALSATGMGFDAALFQSCSAFFGVGFTTREAESVMRHPVRRRIIMHLIVLGNVGLTSALATLIVTFTQTQGFRETIDQLLIIAGGVVVLILLIRLRVVKAVVDYSINLSIRGSKTLQIYDYEMLLKVSSGYCVSDIMITGKGPLAGKSLAVSHPTTRGLIVLGIERENGTYIGAPGPDERILKGDVVTVYGQETEIQKLMSEQETTAEGGDA